MHKTQRPSAFINQSSSQSKHTAKALQPNNLKVTEHQEILQIIHTQQQSLCHTKFIQQRRWSQMWIMCQLQSVLPCCCYAVTRWQAAPLLETWWCLASPPMDWSTTCLAAWRCSSGATWPVQWWLPPLQQQHLHLHDQQNIRMISKQCASNV